MMVSTRGRYALRVMIDLAENGKDELVAMKNVAQRQRISLKYLEQILPILVKAGMIEGIHGKGGGYRLTKLPEEYRISDILKLTEKNLAPVACLCEGAEPCEYTAECRTLPMWEKLNNLVNEYLSSVTLADIMKSEI